MCVLCFAGSGAGSCLAELPIQCLICYIEVPGKMNLNASGHMGLCNTYIIDHNSISKNQSHIYIYMCVCANMQVHMYSYIMVHYTSPSTSYPESIVLKDSIRKRYWIHALGKPSTSGVVSSCEPKNPIVYLHFPFQVMF